MTTRVTVIFTLACLTMTGCALESDLPEGPRAYSVIPAEAAPAPPGQYLLAPSDTVSVSVFLEPEVSVDAVQIDPAGNLDLPLVGRIRAEGRRPPSCRDGSRRRYLATFAIPR